MNGCMVITTRDVKDLVDKIYNSFKPLTSSTLVAPSNVYEAECSPDQSNGNDELSHHPLFAPSQQPSQSQVWPSDSDDTAHSLSAINIEASQPSANTTSKISSLERYLSPAFKQPEKYLKLWQIVRVLLSIQASQIEGKMLQIRRIYYEDKELFKTQDNVCTIVRCLEDYWAVPSSSFNLLPALKGLYAGPLGYMTREALVAAQHKSIDEDCNDTASSLHVIWGVTWSSNETFVYKKESILDSSQIHSLKTNSKIHWVLVVEKETVFFERLQELNRDRAQGDSWSKISAGIIITGKGLPDYATRRMLELIANVLPASVPFYALMDGDAYGMHIYHTYCTSIRHHHDSTQQMANRLEWIGLKPSDSLSVIQKYITSCRTGSMQGSGAVRLDLNEYDRAHFMATNDQVKYELQMEALRLILYGYKLELEAIADTPLSSLLPQDRTV